MAECPGPDEVKDAIETILKTDMAATIAAVNTDRGVVGGDQITAPAAGNYYKDNRKIRWKLAVQILVQGEPEPIIEVGSRQAWRTEYKVSVRYIGKGEATDTVKKKLDMYRDVLNRILWKYANKLLGLGTNGWETNVLGYDVSMDKPKAGWASVMIEVYVKN